MSQTTQTIDKSLALFLADCCIQAYNQYSGGTVDLSSYGYTVISTFTAFVPDKSVAEPFGFIAQSSDSVVVSFRGTDSLPDWVADADASQMVFPYAAGGVKSHKGFTNCYISCREQIIPVLKGLSPNLKLYITGHSLGGGLSFLNALDVAVNTSFTPVLLNFAGPRTGDPCFVATYNSQTASGKIASSTRVVNVHDIVPMLPPTEVLIPIPPEICKYGHVDSEFTINVQTKSIVGNHSINTYKDAIAAL